MLEALWRQHGSHKNIGKLPYTEIIEKAKQCLALVSQYKVDVDVWEVGLPPESVVKELQRLIVDLEGSYADVQKYIVHARGIAGGETDELRQQKKNWCNARRYWSDNILDHNDETPIPDSVCRVVAQVQLP